MTNLNKWIRSIRRIWTKVYKPYVPNITNLANSQVSWSSCFLNHSQMQEEIFNYIHNILSMPGYSPEEKRSVWDKTLHHIKVRQGTPQESYFWLVCILYASSSPVGLTWASIICSMTGTGDHWCIKICWNGVGALRRWNPANCYHIAGIINCLSLLCSCTNESFEWFTVRPLQQNLLKIPMAGS